MSTGFFGKEQRTRKNMKDGSYPQVIHKLSTGRNQSLFSLTKSRPISLHIWNSCPVALFRIPWFPSGFCWWHNDVHDAILTACWHWRTALKPQWRHDYWCWYNEPLYWCLDHWAFPLIVTYSIQSNEAFVNRFFLVWFYAVYTVSRLSLLYSI